jgi:hypothetical protein
VLVESEDVVQADWHHVVDAGFARAEHNAEKFCQGTFCQGTGTWQMQLRSNYA